MAAHKTEALYFYGRASGKPPETRIQVSGIFRLVGDRLKYLGLLLDGKWRFGHHFDALAPSVERMSAALGRLLFNLRGPDGSVRRIYVGTINSVALYGAPVWAKELAAMRRARDAFRRIQRSMATRVTRAYQTVSHAAGSVLTGWPPLEFLALMHQQVYEREKELQRRPQGPLLPRVRKAIRLQARRSMVQKWDAHLSDPQTPGQRTVGAIRPCLAEWTGLRGRSRTV